MTSGSISISPMPTPVTQSWFSGSLWGASFMSGHDPSPVLPLEPLQIVSGTMSFPHLATGIFLSGYVGVVQIVSGAVSSGVGIVRRNPNMAW